MVRKPTLHIEIEGSDPICIEASLDTLKQLACLLCGNDDVIGFWLMFNGKTEHFFKSSCIADPMVIAHW